MSERTCSNCGKKGHRRDHCLEGERSNPKDVRSAQVLDRAVRKEVLTADDIREKVVEMQEQGMTSIRIAQQLRVPLSTVNKYWVRDRLADATDDDVPEAVEETVEDDEDDLI